MPVSVVSCLHCVSGFLFYKNGILPSRENYYFQIAGALLVLGTLLLFYSLAVVLIQTAQFNKHFYLKGLNTFLVRQIGSKIRTIDNRRSVSSTLPAGLSAKGVL